VVGALSFCHEVWHISGAQLARQRHCRTWLGLGLGLGSEVRLRLRLRLRLRVRAIHDRTVLLVINRFRCESGKVSAPRAEDALIVGERGRRHVLSVSSGTAGLGCVVCVARRAG
jgi:hypothetical protein